MIEIFLIENSVAVERMNPEKNGIRMILIPLENNFFVE